MALADDPEKRMLAEFLGGDGSGEEEDGEEWMDMACYEFNERLPVHLDDRRCVHCRKYLTLACPQIDELMEEADVD